MSVKNKSRTFTDEQIRAIFLDPDSGVETAKKYRCSPGTISLIRRRETFANITEGLEPPLRKRKAIVKRSPNKKRDQNTFPKEDVGIIHEPKILNLAQSRAW